MLYLDKHFQSTPALTTVNLKISLERKGWEAHDEPKIGDVVLWGEFKYYQRKDDKGKLVFDKNGEPVMDKKWQGHTGIVTDIGKNGRFTMVNAVGTNKGVQENSNISKTWSKKEFIGFYRPKEGEDTPDVLPADYNPSSPYESKEVRDNPPKSDEKENN